MTSSDVPPIPPRRPPLIWPPRRRPTTRSIMALSLGCLLTGWTGGRLCGFWHAPIIMDFVILIPAYVVLAYIVTRWY